MNRLTPLVVAKAKRLSRVLEVPGSIPGRGTLIYSAHLQCASGVKWYCPVKVGR